MNKLRDLFSKTLVVGVIVLFIGVGVQTTFAFINTSNGFIQDLIDNASDGDTIYIPSGIYYESINIYKSISLIGEDKNNTIIDGGGVGNVINFTANNIYMSGFTIRNCRSLYPYNDAGIRIKSNDNTITDNIITLNKANGIFLSKSENNKIIDNTITLNERDGILSRGSKFNIIENNIITINGDNGIIFDNSKNNVMKDNNISSNIEYGIAFVNSASNTIERNVISLNNGGIYLFSSGFNTIKQNKINYNDEFGIKFRKSKFNTISDNSISSNDYSGITISYSISWFHPDGIILPSRFNFIRYNNISDNRKYGIYIEHSHFNYIIKNNFVNNGKDAFFEKCYTNRWKRNYWSEPRVLPKLIVGRIWYSGDEIQTWIPIVNIDWHPAKEPYDIQ